MRHGRQAVRVGSKHIRVAPRLRARCGRRRAALAEELAATRHVHCLPRAAPLRCARWQLRQTHDRPPRHGAAAPLRKAQQPWPDFHPLSSPTPQTPARYSASIWATRPTAHTRSAARTTSRRGCGTSHSPMRPPPRVPWWRPGRLRVLGFAIDKLRCTYYLEGDGELRLLGEGALECAL